MSDLGYSNQNQSRIKISLNSLDEYVSDLSGMIETPEPAYEKIDGLTFSTTSGEDRQSSRASWSMRDVVASVLVLILIIAAYLYFTG